MDRIGLGPAVVGGLVGGVLFGMLMQMMGMMPMVAQLVGSETVAVGWMVHLVISIIFALVYVLVVGSAGWSGWGSAVGLGAVYGVILWVVGALLIMPAWLGMSEMIFQVGGDQWQSLMGHVIFAVALGLVYEAMTRTGPATGTTATSH